MAVAHSTLTGADLHECKGAASATAGQVPVASGTGSAPFATLSYSQLANTPTLSTVASTGAYADLLNKPLIPAVYNGATITPQTPLIKSYTVGAVAGVWTISMTGFTSIHNVIAQGFYPLATDAATTLVAGVTSYTLTSATGTVVFLSNPPALGTNQTVIVTVIGY